MADGARKAARAAIAPLVNPNEQFSQQGVREIRRFLPLQNSIPLNWALNAVGGQLPKSSTVTTP
jgi:hypothetical protein